MRTFHLRIYKADATFYEGEAESLVIPAVDGAYGVMANHENIVCAIIPGLLKYRIPGQEDRYAFVTEGMMRVEDNDVLIIVNAAEHPEDIDEAREREAEEAAREAMLQKKSVQEYALAEAALHRAIARLRVKEHEARRM